MSTLTATYCSVCASLRFFGRAWIKSTERVGRARAAAQLSQMGMHEEAKRVMMQD